MAIIVALEKCCYWLRGCPHFTVRTDHKSLESIYNNKPLDEISDEILDIVVSTYHYNFTVEYIRGKDNELADHLSRHPIWSQESEDFGLWITDDFSKKITVESHINTVQTVNRYKDKCMKILYLTTCMIKEQWKPSTIR